MADELSPLQKRLIWTFENKNPKVALYVAEICATHLGEFNTWLRPFTVSFENYIKWLEYEDGKDFAQGMVDAIREDRYVSCASTSKFYEIYFSQGSFELSKVVPWLTLQVEKALKNAPKAHDGELFRVHWASAKSAKSVAIRNHWPLPYFAELGKVLDGLLKLKNINQVQSIPDAFRALKKAEKDNSDANDNVVWRHEKWSCHELKNLAQIKKDGEKQAHCLRHVTGQYGYKYYSLRKEGERKLTIQVSSTGNVYSALGRQNSQKLPNIVHRNREIPTVTENYLIRLNRAYDKLKLALQDKNGSLHGQYTAIVSLLYPLYLKGNLCSFVGYKYDSYYHPSLKELKEITNKLVSPNVSYTKIEEAFVKLYQDMKWKGWDHLIKSKSKNLKALKGIKLYEDVYKGVFDKPKAKKKANLKAA